MVSALTDIVAKTVTKKEIKSIGEVHRVVIPSGETLSKSKEMEGGCSRFLFE